MEKWQTDCFDRENMDKALESFLLPTSFFLLLNPAGLSFFFLLHYETIVLIRESSKLDWSLVRLVTALYTSGQAGVHDMEAAGLPNKWLLMNPAWATKLTIWWRRRGREPARLALVLQWYPPYLLV